MFGMEQQKVYAHKFCTLCVDKTHRVGCGVSDSDSVTRLMGLRILPITSIDSYPITRTKYVKPNRVFPMLRGSCGRGLKPDIAPT